MGLTELVFQFSISFLQDSLALSYSSFFFILRNATLNLEYLLSLIYLVYLVSRHQSRQDGSELSICAGARAVQLHPNPRAEARPRPIRFSQPDQRPLPLQTFC